MYRIRYILARSNNKYTVILRNLWRRARGFSLPVSGRIVRPILWAFLAIRMLYHGSLRIFICEPLFKAYCTSYGRNFHTGCFVHWVIGRGKIIVGNDVLLDGKSSFVFASVRETEPELEIGDGTVLGHDCTLIVADRIRIGANCRIAASVRIFDSPGHPNDAIRRLKNAPPDLEAIRPVTIGDNVWIGYRAIIFPGVTIGANSVISAGSVVMSSIPPNTLVGGHPARKVVALAATAADPNAAEPTC